MKTIDVRATRSYPVIIGENLLEDIGCLVSKVHASCKAAIISDSNVWSVYGDLVASSLESTGYCACNFVFPAGESSKNSGNYLEILNFLADNQLTRTDLIVALGGGVVGDMAGFAAATYLRGVPYIQVPTSLLAMVDSSVGGKTAIDLPAGKNLAGAFYQPKCVICDYNVLNTLPEDIFRDGCAEVIKYGILYDPELFQHLYASGLDFDREYVISRCVELKRNVVSEDEFDTGARQKLNLGHTFGHAIEKNSNFTVTHGQAVAIGMAIAARASSAYGICEAAITEAIISILKKFKLPVTTDYTDQDLYAATLSDKKRAGMNVNLILPRHIGSCIIQATTIDELQPFIKAGL